MCPPTTTLRHRLHIVRYTTCYIHHATCDIQHIAYCILYSIQRISSILLLRTGPAKSKPQTALGYCILHITYYFLHIKYHICRYCTLQRNCLAIVVYRPFLCDILSLVKQTVVFHGKSMSNAMTVVDGLMALIISPPPCGQYGSPNCTFRHCDNSAQIV
jgi:hypothetical protein